MKALPSCPADPAQALEPYRPEHGHGPWDRRGASQLLRRALGGARPGQLPVALDEGPQAAAERLFAPADAAHEEQLAALGQTLARGADRRRLAAWWLLKLLDEQRATGARLALFWHGHFACAQAKVDDLSALCSQHQLFVDRGAGPFAELLSELIRDPALLRFLDGDGNRRGRPNENLARELLELFTLGEGAYSEEDIRGAARALTGYSLGRDGFRFIPEHHDPDSKQVLGRTIDDGDDLLAAAVAQPACPRWLAGRLWRFYVSPEPPSDVLELLAERWRAQDLRVDWLLKTLLSSRAFFSAESYRSLVKSPVDYAIGALRASDLRPDLVTVARACDEMGQRLFDPPGVQGWAGGQAWIHAAAWIVRVNYAARLAKLAAKSGDGSDESLLPGRLAGDAEGLVGHLVERLLDDDLGSARRRSLVAAAAQNSEAGPGSTAVQSVLCAPEYHLS